ncbi:MAG: outer membrane lipoprotein-sorting protein [Bacteroidetes bacterium]|nr:outer membrane lipoprotein-sorting protein [Bacteroidota bacterium]
MKRTFLISIILIIAGILTWNPIRSQETGALEIVKKSQDKANGLSSVGTMKMTIVRPDWTREVTMKAWSKTTDYSMILITAPANDKGQVFLKRFNEMWNWMPNINRMIKLPPSMMSQSWMGSDFTNDDLVRMNSIVNDYTHAILGSETIEGLDCYKIELIPKPEAAVVWGKVILWISKDEYYQMKAEYYDEDKMLVTTMIASEIKQMGDRKLPSKMVMISEDKKGNETRLEMIDTKFNVPIDEGFFSQQNMKTVR